MGLNGFVDWTDVPKTDKNNNKSSFLKLESGNEYRIRPVHRMYKFYKYFYRNPEGQLRTAIVADPDKCPVRKAHPEANLKAVERYAFFLIDREDGSLKIAEVPKSVITPMSDKARHSKKQCGQSQGAWDWIIQVVGKGLKTDYKVIVDEPTNLTKEEVDLYKAAVGDDNEKLAKLYAANSPEEIEKRLFGELEAKEKGGQQKASAPKKVAVKEVEEDFPVDDELASAKKEEKEEEWSANF